jgi:hypothetical protein
MSEPREVTLTDPADPAKKFPGIEQYMQYYPGLKVSNRYSVGACTFRLSSIESVSSRPGFSKSLSKSLSRIFARKYENLRLSPPSGFDKRRG